MVKPAAKTPRTSRAPVKSARKRSPNAVFYVALGLVAAVGLGTLGYVASRGSDRQVVALDPTLPPVKPEG